MWALYSAHGSMLPGHKRTKILTRSVGHQCDLPRGLEQLKTLFLILQHLLRRSCRAPQSYPIPLAGIDYFRDGPMQLGIGLIAAKPEGKREVARADEQRV